MQYRCILKFSAGASVVVHSPCEESWKRSLAVVERDNVQVRTRMPYTNRLTYWNCSLIIESFIEDLLDFRYLSCLFLANRYSSAGWSEDNDVLSVICGHFFKFELVNRSSNDAFNFLILRTVHANSSDLWIFNDFHHWNLPRLTISVKTEGLAPSGDWHLRCRFSSWPGVGKKTLGNSLKNGRSLTILVKIDGATHKRWKKGYRAVTKHDKPLYYIHGSGGWRSILSIRWYTSKRGWTLVTGPLWAICN